MPYFLKDGSHIYKKEWYEDVVYLPFENMMLPAPACYDAVLRTEYGDYMKIVHAGAVHDFPFYGNMEPTFAKFYDGRIPFNYYKTDVGTLDEHRDKQPGLKDQALSFMELLDEAHEGVRGFIESGDANGAADLLEQCQQGVIQIGTQIDAVYGEEYVTVKHCENYCEAAYQLHEAILGNTSEEPAYLFQELLRVKGEMTESIEKDVHEKKEIVFLPYKPSAWPEMEKLWKREKENPDNNVVVVPIPYFYKNPDGTNSDLSYDLSAYPLYISAVNCNEYDFAGKHPDRIYIQNPYDEYNYVTTVHPFFYAPNIKQHTDELIYVPYFSMEDPEPTDGKAKKMMERYVTMPGVVRADRVIVQSDVLRDAYIDTLSEFMGDETRGRWEERIISDPSVAPDPKFEYSDESIVPESWWTYIGKGESRKKTILYYTSVASLLQYGNDAIDKMRRVFAIFKENEEDVVLLWKHQDLRETTVPERHPELAANFGKLVDEYKEKGYGIYDASPDNAPAFTVADAYYGDVSPLSQKSRLLGMPVMIQDVNI
ncbi:MAG: LicD family protein, partial [Lachnospiraceae bacterium]|nr:LicD family protein [Lachnospiraceae bacterium]